MAPRGGFVYSFTGLAEDSEDGSSAGSSTPGPRTSGHGRADVPRTDVERPEHPAGDGAATGAEGRREGSRRRGPRPGWSSSAATSPGVGAAPWVWCVFIAVGLYIAHVSF